MSRQPSEREARRRELERQCGNAAITHIRQQWRRGEYPTEQARQDIDAILDHNYNRD